LVAALVAASGVAADAQFHGGTIVTFPSAPIGGAAPNTMRGRFNVPKAASGRVPAVVYVHGTAGVDGRGAFNAFALNETGIATLEIDMWEAAGLAPSQNDRVRLVDREQYAYGALKFLAAQPQIDASRIGIEGESMGGGVTLQAARSARTSRSFRAGRTGGTRSVRSEGVPFAESPANHVVAAAEVRLIRGVRCAALVTGLDGILRLGLERHLRIE
jgi:hypothetical protein